LPGGGVTRRHPGRVNGAARAAGPLPRGTVAAWAVLQRTAHTSQAAPRRPDEPG
jgi:hypothetical protein